MCYGRIQMRGVACMRTVGFYVLMATLTFLGIATCSSEQPKSSAAPSPFESAYPSREDAILRSQSIIREELTQNGGWRTWVDVTQEFRASLSEQSRTAARVEPSTPRTKFVFAGMGEYWFHEWELIDRTNPKVFESSESDALLIPPIVLESLSAFSRYLKERGIDLIFVPVPGRIDIYPEEIAARSPPSSLFPDPYLRAALLSILDAHVEVIDLFPEFRIAKEEGKGPLYHRANAHYNAAGIALAAKLLAQTLFRYDFVREGFADRAAFTEQDVEVSRYFEKPLDYEDDAVLLGCDTCIMTQVLDSDGNVFQADEESPILVVGDSFAGHPIWNDRLGTKGASLAAHLSKEIRLSVSLLWGYGEGATAPRFLARKGEDFLKGRHVLIWVMAADHLTPSFSSEWRDGAWP